MSCRYRRFVSNDLIVAAAATGRQSTSKGQFLRGRHAHIAQKAVATGNRSIMLTERGTTFGYRDW
jgi:2-dehydro-3-deoxyphosphooctonate aldolase (KDO 8-P synthase)